MSIVANAPTKHARLLAWVEEMAALGEAGAGASSIRIAREAEDGALLVFDTPQVNERGAGGGLAELMSRLAKAVVGGATVHLLETQRYYAVDFAPAAGQASADAARDVVPARPHRD